MKIGPIIAIILLSGCLDEDLADQFVADGSLRSLTAIASESRVFSCVVTVYGASSSSDPPELTRNFEDWSTTPLTERVHSEAIQIRTLGNSSECWNEEIRTATDAHDPWGYIEAAKHLNSFDHRGSVVLFDLQRKVFIALGN